MKKINALNYQHFTPFWRVFSFSFFRSFRTCQCRQPFIQQLSVCSPDTWLPTCLCRLDQYVSTYQRWFWSIRWFLHLDFLTLLCCKLPLDKGRMRKGLSLVEQAEYIKKYFIVILLFTHYLYSDLYTKTLYTLKGKFPLYNFPFYLLKYDWIYNYGFRFLFQFFSHPLIYFQFYIFLPP